MVCVNGAAHVIGVIKRVRGVVSTIVVVVAATVTIHF